MRLLGSKPGGGTIPMREPSGKIGSAADAGAAASAIAMSERNTVARKIMNRLLRAPGSVLAYRGAAHPGRPAALSDWSAASTRRCQAAALRETQASAAKGVADEASMTVPVTDRRSPDFAVL